MRELLTFIMRGRVHAVGSTAALALLMPFFSVLGLLSTAIVILVGMAKGLREGLLVAFAAALALAVMHMLTTGQPMIAAEFAYKMWLPALLLAAVMVKFQSLSLALMVAMGLAYIVVITMFVISVDPSADWYEFISKEFIPALDKAGMQMEPQFYQEETQRLFARLMTGSTAAAYMLGQILCLLLARSWQAMLYRPGAYGDEFRQLGFGRALALWLVLVVLLTALTGNDLLLSLVMPTMLLFVMQGLAILHQLIKSRNMGGAWLVALYIMMIVGLPYSLMLIAVLGVLDNGFHFRRRLTHS